MARQAHQENQRRDVKRWTPQEDETLLRYVRARPQNLHYVFMMVSEELGRTPTAVQAHWYSVLSKKPNNWCFFTASPHHVSRNRKNGEGVPSTSSIWHRLMNVLRSFC